MMTNPALNTLLEQRLSAERLAPYRAACGGDLDAALALYEQNSRIGAAFWRTLGHVEVLVRNTVHAALQDWSGRADWYVPLAGLLTEKARKDVITARERLVRNGHVDTPGRVVTELSFGFWRYLLAARYERTLWLPCLRGAFPHLTGMRKDVHDKLAGLHELRNRIAHHEPVHNRPLRRLRADALVVAGWICPSSRAWVGAGCWVPGTVGGVSGWRT
ncbi:Abi family protein [Allokutzneria multivorans]|uniref:Abi family protein n=1 Tax=Allokutzneria multivorans TaxID=1142134 RepID=A0ABP7TNA7_9PSEU